jgi:hypothetical protein
MKKLVLITMIALMSGTFDAVATPTSQTEVCKKKRKKKQKRAYSNQHSWKTVSIGRTCNKRRR